MFLKPLNRRIVLFGFVIAVVCGCRTSGEVAAAAVQASPAPPAATQTAAGKAGASMPNREGSLKFGVLGDFGTGAPRQYILAARMAELHQTFPFDLVTLVGDNLYGSERPQDFKQKFEDPYKPLLDAKVRFYASLGNHDAREQRYYKLFNMDGKLYYTFKAPKQDVRFFALESTYLEPDQVKWLEDELKSAKEKWKIAFFHHPLYSSGKTHGSDDRVKEVLEPLFLKYGVSLVLSGHDHIYERVKPQQGITYFVAGSGGQLRVGDTRPSMPFSAKVVDDVNVFLVAEIDGDTLTFEAISQTGAVVDSGVVQRREVN